ncbi:hypothetical protein [Argonema galeatum]|uniref:hypothetical protein n=1 Tax=Argonema galeatum TaxID=2942762 RepID=UPI002013BD0E|nr:hypothetical protein [Argonema galeatum]MCL1467792.1 hypothetical protein [Argonema galeatum A003/A1]
MRLEPLRNIFYILIFLRILFQGYLYYHALFKPNSPEYSSEGYLTAKNPKSSSPPNPKISDSPPAYPPKLTQFLQDIKNNKNCNSSTMTLANESAINCGPISINIGDSLVKVNITINVINTPNIDAKDGQPISSVEILLTNHQWKKGSTSEVSEIQNEANVIPLKSLIDEMKKADWAQLPFKNATDIIAVGTASFEVQGNDINTEKKRANDRAVNLYREIYTIIPNKDNKNLWTLNLGKYQDNCSVTTSSNYQRPVLIIAILERKNNVDDKYIKKVLKRQLTSFNGTKVNYMCYSGSDFSDLSNLKRVNQPSPSESDILP